jgi:ABC-type glycerol-3-phosphate transport system permease component
LRAKRSEIFAVNIVIIFILVLMIFPFYWMVSCTFKTQETLVSLEPKLIPTTFSIEFYKELFDELNVARNLLNSVYLSVFTALLVTLTGSLAAYSLAIYRYPGRILLGRFVLFLYMFPPILAAIPLYLLFSQLRLINTHIALLITYTAFNLPVVMWVLRSYFVGIPLELVDAALIDGLSRVKALFKIIMPLAAPGIAAGAIMAFIGAWSEFLFANTFILSEHLKTLTVRVVDYSVREGINWGPILSISTIIVLPTFFYAMFAQRFLVSGLTAGAVKG